MKTLIHVVLFYSLLPLVFAAAPSIISVNTNATSFDPTEAANTSVFVSFLVNDGDGIGNLVNSSCKCEFDNAFPFITLYEAANASCSAIGVNDSAINYTCSIPFQYWYENNTYGLKATIADNETIVNDTSKSLAYTTLIASTIDLSSINFGTISSYNTNVTDSNSPLTITNTGNKQLQAKITGADLSNNTNITVTRFYVDTDNNAAGALRLANVQQTISGATAVVEDSTPGGNTRDLWFFFFVPNTLLPGSYNGIWTLVEE